MPEKTQEQLIQETHQSVSTLTTVLLGVPGTDEKGLVGEVRQVKIGMKDQQECHNKLSMRVWILWGGILAVMVIASGIVTLSGMW